MDNLKKRIFKHLKDLGKTKEWFYANTDTTASGLELMFSNESLRVRVVKDIAKALNLSVLYLLTGQDKAAYAPKVAILERDKDGFLKRFDEKIRAQLWKMDRSQKWLHGRVGVSQTGFYRMISRNTITVVLLKKIAEVLEVNIKDLIDDSVCLPSEIEQQQDHMVILRSIIDERLAEMKKDRSWFYKEMGTDASAFNALLKRKSIRFSTFPQIADILGLTLVDLVSNFDNKGAVNGSASGSSSASVVGGGKPSDKRDIKEFSDKRDSKAVLSSFNSPSVLHDIKENFRERLEELKATIEILKKDNELYRRLVEDMYLGKHNAYLSPDLCSYVGKVTNSGTQFLRSA